MRTNNFRKNTIDIDHDFLHGVTRSVYVKALVRGGADKDNLRTPPDKLERYAEAYKTLVRSVLVVLIERGTLSVADMRPNEEDTKRFNTEEDLVKAGIPVTDEQIREIFKSCGGERNKKGKKRVSESDAENTAKLEQTTRTRERERAVRER